MQRTCIAVVDATRARLFTLDRMSDAEGLREELREQRDLVNLARRRRPSELFADSYGWDDHRDAAIDELDTGFARAILAELRELTQASPPHRIVLCASPRMLGKLRELREGFAIPFDELPRDLVKLTPAQLRDQLATQGLLPPEPPRRVEGRP